MTNYKENLPSSKMGHKRAKNFPEANQSRESWRLFQANNPYICPYVFSGPTINPDGRLLVCCHAAGNRNEMGHISEVENLNDWYNTGLIKNQREIMHSGMWTLNPCGACINRQNRGMKPHAHIDAVTLPFDGNNLDQNPKQRKTIRYLEYTPSNICNQSCVTCGGVFSSLWWSIDKVAIEQEKLKFRYNPTNARTRQLHGDTQGVDQLTENDYQKIEQCIKEGVWKVYIKGGEPFADERNLEFMERIGHNEYPELRQLQMSTNLARMTPRIIRLLDNIRNNTKCGIGMSLSIDGIGKQYQWIRSTPYDRLIENIRKTPADHISASITMSPYNFYNIPEMVNELVTKLPITPQRIGGRSVYNPAYLNVANIFDKEHIKKQYERNKLHLDREPYISRWDQLQWAWDVGGQGIAEDREEILNQYREFTQFMNERRGFNIEDHVPELKNI